MKNPRGFTLIELLIVVAIIAILAAIAVPNFLEAQTRAKVSRVLSDMRTLGTAIESYSVDYNGAPACAFNDADTLALINDEDKIPKMDDSIFGGWTGLEQPLSMNIGLVERLAANDWQPASPGFYRSTFAFPNHGSGKQKKLCLTTPVAYISAFPYDPFTKEPFVNYGYVALAEKGWMLWSAGPDMDLTFNADRDGLNGSPLDLAFTSFTSTVDIDGGSGSLSLLGAMRWNHLPPGTKMPRADGSRMSWLLGTNNEQKRVKESFWINAKREWSPIPDSNPDGVEIPFDYTGTNPTSGLLFMTYDATNGSLSSGDVWKLND